MGSVRKRVASWRWWRQVDSDPAESGLSLIEVVVALALIGIVAAAAALFFIRGVSTASKIQRDQTAISVATQAMELVRGIDPQNPENGSTNRLVIGRSKAAVQAQWGAATAEDKAATIAAWDTAATSTSTPNVPLVSKTTVSNIEYTVNTLIGKCYRISPASSAPGDCVGTATGIETYRVTVIVTWSERACGTAACSYRLVSLIDPNPDAEWNLSLNPVPLDDETTVTVGGPQTLIWVMGNDEIEPGNDNRVILMDKPDPSEGKGTVALSTGDEKGGIVYTPPSNYTGLVEFTYMLRDSLNRPSTNTATVRVLVLPLAVDDTAGVEAGSTTSIDVTANDIGTIDSIVLGDEPQTGFSATVNGKKIDVTVPGSTPEGTVITFTYYARQALETGEWGTSIEPATVTVKVGSCMNAADRTIEIPATRDGSVVTDLEINKLNENKSSCWVALTKLEQIPVKRGEIKVDGSNWNGGAASAGTTIAIAPDNNKPWMVKITYVMRATKNGAATTEPKVITVKVLPVAVDDEYSVEPGEQRDLQVRADNDAPTDNTVSMEILTPLTSGCGTMTPNLPDGKVTYKAPDDERTCVFAYRLVAVDVPQLVSQTATVTINMEYSTTIHSRIASVYSPWRKSSDSGSMGSETVEKIMDNSPTTKWFVGLSHFSGSQAKFPVSAIYRMSVSSKLREYSLTSANDFDERDPADWTIRGSNNQEAAEDPNHSSWTVIDTVEGERFTDRHQTRNFTVDEPDSYRYYQFRVEKTRGSNSEFQIADWTLIR
ncbi:prepilin-type N-terminal cleavage/methylation domain-containing protein [Micrococcales bacterium KH10]|nr:prepilin-type N-terminal cleavage/methylation domain-containing protein [Micrococcales bacterium KH10]